MISLRDIRFAYSVGDFELRVSALEIERGEAVAMVGPSGAGKTTITYLLPRLYDPTEGRITLDGHDLRDVTLSSLRDQIGIVLQETTLFAASIRERHPGAFGTVMGQVRRWGWLVAAIVYIIGSMWYFEFGRLLDASERVLALLRAIAAAQSMTFVMATHDPVLVEFADTVYDLQDGRLVTRVGQNHALS